MRPSLIRPSTVVGVVYLIVLTIFGVVHKYDAFDFVHLGTVWGKGDPGGTWGYDGQFYYQIALNPLGAARFMDNAPFRYQRIVYPILTRLLSLGQPILIPYSLLIVNWLSIISSVEILSRLLHEAGMSPWYSLSYGLYFGQATSLTFDTTEAFTYALVCLGILFYQKHRQTSAALVFGLAAVSRETAVLFPLAYILFFLMNVDWRNVFRYIGLGIIPLAIWLMILARIFGKTGVSFAPPFEHIPFYGIFAQSAAPRKFPLLIVTMLVPTAAAGILAGRRLLQWRIHPLLFAWIANILMIVFLSRFSYLDLISCSRISVGLTLSGIVYGIVTHDKVVLIASQYYLFIFGLYIIGIVIGASFV